jgi:GNAT superfamily N-acetyltransferase
MIRRAGADDSAALVALCSAHARFERAPAGTEPDADGLRAGLSGASPALCAWIAEEAAVAVGYASGHASFCTWRGRRTFHLDCLYLREEWRGKGLGRALLDAVVSHASEHGAERVEWLTPCWNAPAIGFYRQLGATDEPRQRFRLAIQARL